MNVEGQLGARRQRGHRPRWALWAGAALVVLMGAVFYLRERAIAELQGELERLAVREQELLEEMARLEERLALKDDPDWLEYLARRELGVIRPDEEKYLLRRRLRP